VPVARSISSWGLPRCGTSSPPTSCGPRRGRLRRLSAKHPREHRGTRELPRTSRSPSRLAGRGPFVRRPLSAVDRSSRSHRAGSANVLSSADVAPRDAAHPRTILDRSFRAAGEQAVLVARSGPALRPATIRGRDRTVILPGSGVVYPLAPRFLCIRSIHPLTMERLDFPPLLDLLRVPVSKTPRSACPVPRPCSALISSRPFYGLRNVVTPARRCLQPSPSIPASSASLSIARLLGSLGRQRTTWRGPFGAPRVQTPDHGPDDFGARV